MVGGRTTKSGTKAKKPGPKTGSKSGSKKKVARGGAKSKTSESSSRGHLAGEARRLGNTTGKKKSDLRSAISQRR